MTNKQEDKADKSNSIPKKNWETPICQDLDDLKIEGGVNVSLPEGTANGTVS